MTYEDCIDIHVMVEYKQLKAVNVWNILRLAESITKGKSLLWSVLETDHLIILILTLNIVGSFVSLVL